MIVDPGPDDEAHLRAIADRGPVAAVLITHGHPDHVEGLDRLLALTGAPVRRLPVGVPTPLAGLYITAIDTPGHTSDSVCFLVEVGDEAVVLTGDTILGRGTAVVAWPDGDLGDYLVSLRRLRAFTGVPVLPGHGPPRPDCAATAACYLAHRQERLEQVRQAVAAGADTPAAVVERVYTDVERALWPAAEWSVRAQLAYLGQRESLIGTGPLDPP